MANKRYSLKERVTYYNRVSDYELKHNKNSNRLAYACGFIQGAEHGLSLDYAKLDKYEKAGQMAGLKARKKSESLKF